MGINGRFGSKYVSRLESGRIPSPALDTIARFLRACGARWYQLCYVLEPVETIDVVMPEAANQLLPKPAIERVRATVRDETWRYSKNRQEFFHLRPETPETRPISIGKFMTYRMLENLVQQGVMEVLRKSSVATITYPAYRGVARQVLGLLWQEAKTEEGRAGLMAELPKCPACICDKLDEKEPDWTDMGLDLELVARVHAQVWACFREMRLKSVG
jgi:hypothetical protein